ncbi:MAG: hypothetical protein EPO08_15985 [Rhodospirillaceae bacterium]|nr:MAG: hypothetical protein EPO08_15985 [Rhodospirillaceae bacterium]
MDTLLHTPQNSDAVPHGGLSPYLTFDDFGWPGDPAISDQEFRSIMSDTVGSRGSLRQILRVIVDSHPITDVKLSPEARVNGAMELLTGRSASRLGPAISPKTRNILERVAILFLKKIFGPERFTHTNVDVRALCRQVMSEADPHQKIWDAEQRRKRAKEIEELFSRGKDRLLVAASFDEESRERHIQQACDGLRSLGIVT